MFSKDADLFFEVPNSNRQPPGYFGVLHLLRKDIYICMGICPISSKAISYKVIWPGAMSILAGIDLLGKFYAGDDRTGKVGERFKKYINAYFNIAPSDEDVIYQLRNSLLHSFGLYSAIKDKKTNKVIKEYHFILGQNLPNFITPLPHNGYLIDVLKLHQKFESSITSYSNDIETASNKIDLQNKFTKMFPIYGTIKIQ